MDLATLIGIVVGCALVAVAIALGGSPALYVSVPSLLLVLGGTLGATLIRNPPAAVLGTLRVTRKAFTTRVPDPRGLISQIVQLARQARRQSLLSLEKTAIEYPFLAKGIHLCVDGLEPAEIRGILETEIEATASRHRRGQETLEGIGAAAPAFGMIGTLIGLVRMLTSIGDPKTLGPAMAVAILTTLYGATIAHLFALPLADKLRVRSREELLNMSVCLEGVMGLAQGEHPVSIDERLQALVPARSREPKAA